MAKAHSFTLYVRRSSKFNWKLVREDVKKSIEEVRRIGQIVLARRYHSHGEIYILDNLTGYKYTQIRKPKMIALQQPPPYVEPIRPSYIKRRPKKSRNRRKK